ncbi:MAG: L-aspartate oxidase [Phycisphaeraceae bacterium]|nr:L-aspartate oxidase [Phycisphaeraceae bacterium]
MHPLFDQRRYLIPFRSSLLPQIFTDVLVIGTGVAGLRAAIAAGERSADVIVLSKAVDAETESSTAWAQGGIAAVIDPADSIDSHVHDTLEAGAGLCDGPVVRRVIEGGPGAMRELLDWGMRFDLRQRQEPVAGRVDSGGARGHGGNGTHHRPTLADVALGQEGAHARARILHADGDATGRELARCLTERLAGLSSVRLFANCFALDLITPGSEPGSPVMGAITHHPRYGLQMIWAKSTVLATGGAGRVFRETTNPSPATADGIAMAYRAGASVADLAFVQFHPTTLYLAGRPRSLISEAVRGEGAYLLDQSGTRFMLEEHPKAELAPRDVVSRAILRRLATHGGTHALLDVRHIRGFSERFPGIAAMLRSCDLDPATDLIPVNPAAHYTIGGVATSDGSLPASAIDRAGETDVPGLFAVGECACTGLHGANRLASNSLLEGLVMGRAVGLAAVERAAGRGCTGAAPASPVSIVSDIRPSDQGELDLPDVLSSLRSAMWRNCGVERSGARLADVAEMIDFWARYTLDKIFDSPQGWQAQNMLLAASLMARSALWREESRGCHRRADHPEPREPLRVHDRWRRGRGAVVTASVVGEHASAASNSAVTGVDA